MILTAYYKGVVEMGKGIIELKAPKKIDDHTAWYHYNEGKSDAEIAAACCVHKNTVANWRRRNMLHANTPQKLKKDEQTVRKKKERVLTPLEQDAKAAREMGMTYGQYKAQQYIAQQKKLPPALGKGGRKK